MVIYVGHLKFKESKTFSEALSKTNYYLNVETLYVFINYLSSKISSSVNLVYFITEFITLLFVYFSCYGVKKICNDYNFCSLSYFLFLILFFNKSLNLCRQSIAIAIILYAIKYIYQKKPIKYILFCILASGFHSSSLIMIILYFYINYINRSKNKILKNLIIIILLFTLIIGYNKMFYRQKIFIIYWNRR